MVVIRITVNNNNNNNNNIIIIIIIIFIYSTVNYNNDVWHKRSEEDHLIRPRMPTN